MVLALEKSQHFTSVIFRNYKALKNFSVSLGHCNILVGPNNSGKSTILGAFRILSEGMRRARSRKPTVFREGGNTHWGYQIHLDNLPISTENVFTNYDEKNPASIVFRLSGGNSLELIFPDVGSCYLVTHPNGKPVRTPTAFRGAYPATIGFVPVLGPVEHEEQLYQREAARQALLTHRASRNFRNIWYHFSNEFDEFRDLIRNTWPGMDIDPPEVQIIERNSTLFMFCPEERYPREIYWAGFGFQVWCQMLTYAIRARHDTILIIDEPDIYLHSDLQRQLLSILQNLGPDILIATHSTEIITESDPGDLLIINKMARSGKRIKSPMALQSLFGMLGSNLNPILTQLARTRRAIYVEGKDFQILSVFARKMGFVEVANRSGFAVVPLEGYNPSRIDEYSNGIEFTLGQSIRKAVILDRDYRSDGELDECERDSKESVSFIHVHRRKEIENYLLEIAPLERAIRHRIAEQGLRANKNVIFDEDVKDILDKVTGSLKHKISGRITKCYVDYHVKVRPSIDRSELMSEVSEWFEWKWADMAQRVQIVPGKQVLTMLNKLLQERYGISLSPKYIAGNFNRADVPNEIAVLIERMDVFRRERLS